MDAYAAECFLCPVGHFSQQCEQFGRNRLVETIFYYNRHDEVYL